MVQITFAKNDYISLISEFENKNFFNEAYSKDVLSDMLSDNYILFNNLNIFSLCDNDELIGYIIFSITEDFTDILKIFVRENDRRKHYASMLIDKIINLAKRYHSKKIMVEVRSKNYNAINFYKSNLFSQISIRKNYYKNPIDDALIFERIYKYD